MRGERATFASHQVGAISRSEMPQCSVCLPKRWSKSDYQSPPPLLNPNPNPTPTPNLNPTLTLTLTHRGTVEDNCSTIRLLLPRIQLEIAMTRRGYLDPRRRIHLRLRIHFHLRLRRLHVHLHRHQPTTHFLISRSFRRWNA